MPIQEPGSPARMPPKRMRLLNGAEQREHFLWKQAAIFNPAQQRSSWRRLLLVLAVATSNDMEVESLAVGFFSRNICPVVLRQRATSTSTFYQSWSSSTTTLYQASSRSKSSTRAKNLDDNSSEYNLWEEPLTANSFNMDLQNLAMEDPQKAQDALEVMEHMYQQGSSSAVQPDSACYTTVMEGWCYGRPEEIPVGPASAISPARKIQGLLDRMEMALHLQPNEICYLVACQAWADAVSDETPTGRNAQNAQDILDRLLLLQKPEAEGSNDANGPQRRRRIPISTKLYSIVLEGWCRRVGRVSKAMDKVEDLLTDMEQASVSDHTDSSLPRPNVLTYTSVIGAIARTQDKDMGQRALDILDRMRNHGVEPDMVAYTSVLNCWAKTRGKEERKESHTQALRILKEMEDLYVRTKGQVGDNHARYDVKPTSITYAIAIKAIGNSFASNAPNMAEDLIHHMKNMTDSGTINVRPTVETYNALIMSLSSGRPNANWSRAARARRAEHWLVEMIKGANQTEAPVAPNVRSWGAVLKAWADSGRPDAGEQAQRVLDLMIKWQKSGKSTVAPNTICYTTVINAWARSSSKPAWVALKEIEGILQYMEHAFATTGDLNIRPSKITYISVMDAYTRKMNKAKAAAKAQALVDRMLKLFAEDQGFVRPTRIIFNALINAYSKSDDPGAAPQAEQIFRWMETQYQAGDEYVKPDEVTICGVLNAWANHATNGGAARAQQILDHIESLPEEERDFAHSIIFYNILIKAWGRSREPGSVQRAEAILIHLEEQYQEANAIENSMVIRPDVTTYSSVINCCAYYSGNEAGRQEALAVALRTFQKIQDDKTCDEGPNMITFGTVFKAIAKLMPVGSQREELVSKIFAQCQESGQVGPFVLSQVKVASSSELYTELVLKPSKLGPADSNNFEKIFKSMPVKWGRSISQWDY